ncbi:Uncharacterized protein TCM_044555 [Theobroma cacao]|uniref:DUF1985 domain-containing protein n=1 Tax=Theobroma cacao TaxID=3641 RepID=A0A061FX95_THECC|nr:Uncharacterized protein TCM_044555 [Theobroma cacao]
MPKEKWVFNVSINTHCKWSQLHYITKTLQQKGEYDLVKRTCFGMLLDVYPQRYFYVGLLHSIMIRQILRASQWTTSYGLPLARPPGDATKMAFILIANNILFDQDYRRRVTPWLLSLVEDIDAWNVFPWGHYVWKLTLDYLLKGFKVLNLSVTKETRLRYNIYGFAWVIQLWALEMLEPTTDEAFREYFVDFDVPLSKGHEASGGTKRMHASAALVDELMDEGDEHGQGSEQPLDHGPAAPEPPTGHPQMQSGNDPSVQKRRQHAEVMIGPQAPIGPAPPQTANEPSSRTVNDGAVTIRQLRRIMRKHEKEMLELKASIQSLSVAMQTFKDCIVARILDGLKSQNILLVILDVSPSLSCYAWHVTTFYTFCMECHNIFLVILGVSPSLSCYAWSVTTFYLFCMACDNILLDGPSHGAGLEHDDADDGQHHEPGVDIDYDVLGADREHSDDAEREHLPPVDAFLDAAAGAIVLYRGSTPDAVEIRSSSPESSVVHHGAIEISDQTERARLKMASKYMASSFVDPLVTRRDVRDKIVENYEALKKEESARRNVDILGDQGADFFITLEDPNEEMTSEHIDACLNLLCKRMTGPKSKLTPSVCYTPNFQQKMPKPQCKFQMGCGAMWRIDLVRWMIKVVDSARTSDAKDNRVRACQMTPLTIMMPFICHQAGYFNNIRRKRWDLTPMPLDIHLPKPKVHR